MFFFETRLETMKFISERNECLIHIKLKWMYMFQISAELPGICTDISLVLSSLSKRILGEYPEIKYASSQILTYS